MAFIPLEDEFFDIIGKAQRGLGISDDQLASLAGVSIKILKEVKAGAKEETAIRKLAVPLGLGAKALVASMEKAWYPEQREIKGLVMFNMPYFDMYVNAYIVHDPTSNSAAIIDTSGDCNPILRYLNTQKLNLKCILLTHTHGDHIADLERLKLSSKVDAYVSRLEPCEHAVPFNEGETFELGNLRIETRQTSGHSIGGTTYVIHGLEKPVAIVGDAIFAGSMGGGMISYGDALKNNRSKILTLPEDTVLCPGHGPLTTVGEEKRNNSFFPEFQRTETF